MNKGIGCESCHGRVDEMPLMYAQNTLQMEWCLDCHRNPAKNLRPTSEIYNMAWEAPAEDRPVWCAAGDEKSRRADGAKRELHDQRSERIRASKWLRCSCPRQALTALADVLRQCVSRRSYQKFTSQDELGHFLVDHYKIRTPKDLTSCEVCHR